jgi:maltose O-acetyltransferase
MSFYLSFCRLLVGWLVNLLPSSRCFILKTALLNSVGHKIHITAKICTPIHIYGRGAISIGRHTWISPGARFYTQPQGFIVIRNYCDIGHECVFIPGSHLISIHFRRAGDATCKSIRINSGSWIGACSILFGGASIGYSSVVGTRSTVLSTLSSNSLSAGTPCKFIRNL